MKPFTLNHLYRYFLILVLTISKPVYAQIEITDSHGKYSFDSPPKNVVVLNWALAEQILELGVTPVGMADITGFHKIANQPVVPTETVDVGKRLNPNLTKIRDLNPEIILIGYSQRSLIRPLSNIATVIYFKNFGKRYNNYEKSRERFMELAKLFNKSKFAESKLQSMDKKLAVLRDSLSNEFINETLPNVQLITQSNHNDTTTWLFGNNSMPYYAANELGLTVLSNIENDKFGVSQMTTSELNELIENTHKPLTSDVNETQSNIDCRLIFSNYTSGNIAPEINKNEPGTPCTADLSYQNAFGGVFSVLYLAEAIHHALIKSSQ